MPRAAARKTAPPDPATTRRILQQARVQLFTHGYASCTMDELAVELGMSKKTLYVHFSGKDEMIAAIIEELGADIRRAAEALLANRELNLAEKLRAFVETALEKLGGISPRTLRDLQRYAPELYARIEHVRAKTLPYVFGRFLEEGQLGGQVRDDIPPAIAIEFFLHAMQGLLHPGTFSRLKLAPHDLVPVAIDLFFGGLLTPAGRKQYEKLFPR
jgi:AcrR family transcriptional regulator